MTSLLLAIAAPLVVFPALVAIGGAFHDARIEHGRRKRDRLRRARLGLSSRLP